MDNIVEDVVPYYKNLTSKNVIAIIVDKSRYSERAFKWILENIVPGCDQNDTRFILFSTRPLRAGLDKYFGLGGESLYTGTYNSMDYRYRKISHDMLKEYSKMLNQAPFTLDGVRQSGPGVVTTLKSTESLPVYTPTTQSDTKSPPSLGLETASSSNVNDGWYGYNRAIAFRGERPEDIATRLQKLGVTKIIVAVNQSKSNIERSVQWDADVTKYLTVNATVPVLVVRRDEFLKEGESGMEISDTCLKSVEFDNVRGDPDKVVKMSVINF
ncbi:hypothetical protein HDU76_002684 [Blyttiomyces sp. JEL0837]|nr:hypothetical protein HDU76_002684 [Blyttiomyces sp. JEL0837]